MTAEDAIRDSTQCDRPGCFETPMAFHVRPNPSVSPWGRLNGGELPLPPSLPVAVRRCRKHLHEEGNFTRDEIKAAIEVVDYFHREAQRQATRPREEGGEDWEALQEKVLHFYFVLTSIRYKFGPQ